MTAVILKWCKICTQQWCIAWYEFITNAHTKKKCESSGGKALLALKDCTCSFNHSCQKWLIIKY